MDHPLRQLTDAELRAFEEHGVIHARGLFPEAWIARMAAAVDRVVAIPSFFGKIVSMQDRGFSGDAFVWKLDDDFRDWVYGSPAALIARQLLGCDRVRHFYDQLFVKPAGCHVPTPWHHDVTFWPVDVEKSRQLCSIWISFDPVDRQSSGLEFVRGSHRWPQRFKAVTPDYNPYMLDSDYEDAPDVDARRGDFDLFSPDIEPGDCLIFNAHILHGSSSNFSTETPRRAFSSRWAGEDVVFEDRHATLPLFWEHGLATGDALRGPLFPQVLPHPIPEEGARRGEGPEPPDAAYVQRVMSAVAARTAGG